MNSRTQILLESLAVLPDHSPEWLENPSVRVDLRRAVTEARSILAEKPAVKFFLVAHDEDTDSREYTHEELWSYLQQQANDQANDRVDWEPALNRVMWCQYAPGDVIHFPLGMVLVVKADQSLD